MKILGRRTRTDHADNGVLTTCHEFGWWWRRWRLSITAVTVDLSVNIVSQAEQLVLDVFIFPLLTCLTSLLLKWRSAYGCLVVPQRLVPRVGGVLLGCHEVPLEVDVVRVVFGPLFPAPVFPGQTGGHYGDLNWRPVGTQLRTTHPHRPLKNSLIAFRSH